MTPDASVHDVTVAPGNDDSYVPEHDLLYFEQQVNERYQAASAPDIPAALLPENSAGLPLAWVALPVEEIDLFHASEYERHQLANELRRDHLCRGDQLLMPVHPLDESLYRPDELIRSGIIKFSASYRTVVYEPDQGGPFCDWIPRNQTLMIKLHLENPLPGIPGDRRLPRQRIEKCVRLSDALAAEIDGDEFADCLEIVPEFFGASHRKRGVLFRLLPTRGILPAFSLYSRDRQDPSRPAIVVERMRHLYSNDSRRAAASLGRELARPLIRSMLSGFRAGFSLEMHGQNTLVSLGTNCLLGRVYFRDLEGVIFSEKYRTSLGLPPLFPGETDEELIWNGDSMQRWYNRNLDHDLGRIFSGAIDALHSGGFFSRQDCKVAVNSIRQQSRLAAEAAGMFALHRYGRWLPFSRAPWGNGRRLGHYFRTLYR